MKDFAFAAPSISGLPRHNRSSYAIVAALHVLIAVLVIQLRTQPMRVGTAGSPFASMTAYIPGPPAASSTASAPKPAVVKKAAMSTKAAKLEAKDDQPATTTSAGSAGVVGGQAGSGPVR